ncbi:SPRY-domain-containing protein [Lentinula edodes]|uniref:SPRY-domain-containing protein n=1 Tax=Lentinula edodes TaxID=5353 RepID=A0A1Q3EG13_LENED|nr:SPRY-domain-containing protein [Lentinula edodes]
MSREELVEGDGGFETIEARWLEGLTDDNSRRAYMRAKDYQSQYLPNSLPSDITLSQFLSIQEKGVSAWSFEPDLETLNSLLVHARTEITFLPDPASASCVQSNLPLPKLNEVYYWEVKMFDLPESTNVAIGLATKPYPSFRLPGFNRYSIAYHSNGDKSHNYPFTAQNFGSPLKEGDVLGVGYRPRSGTVFFTRNGRKMEDAFTGLNRYNLFPTIGADGPCSVHVNLGQAGFVFVEANVKKWGLAPSVGTLAPPPAYGSERGSILLDVGGRRRSPRDSSASSPSGTASPTPSRRTHRSRRPRPNSGDPIVSSPLRTAEPITPPPPITPIDEEPASGSNVSTSPRYISPTDLPFHAPPNTNLPPSPGPHDGFDSDDDDHSSAASTSRPSSPDVAGAETYIQALTRSDHRRTGSSGSQTLSHGPDGDSNRLNSSESLSRRDPPAYSPLDAFTYADGVHIDLPAEVITAALEGNTLPASVMGHKLYNVSNFTSVVINSFYSPLL